MFALVMLLSIGADSGVGTSNDAYAKSYLEQVNVFRQQYGLTPFVLDEGLQKTASEHCLWMLNYNNLNHSSLPGCSAENIAQGQATASDAMYTWMNSSGHRANILNPSLTRIGFMGYGMPDGRRFWCQQFR